MVETDISGQVSIQAMPLQIDTEVHKLTSPLSKSLPKEKVLREGENIFYYGKMKVTSPKRIVNLLRTLKNLHVYENHIGLVVSEIISNRQTSYYEECF